MFYVTLKFWGNNASFDVFLRSSMVSRLDFCAGDLGSIPAGQIPTGIQFWMMTQFGTVSNSTSLVWEVKTPAKDLAGNKVSGFCRLQKLLPFFLPFPQDRQPWINTKIRWLMRKRAKFSLKIATNPPLLKNQKIKVFSLKHHIQSLSRNMVYR